MGKVAKITEEYYDDVKRSLASKWRWTRFSKRHIEDVAYTHGISFKTCVQIKNSETYKDYRNQVDAQHPPVKYSARDDLFAYLKERCLQSGVKYREPSHMSIALYQLRQMDMQRDKGMIDLEN